MGAVNTVSVSLAGQCYLQGRNLLQKRKFSNIKFVTAPVLASIKIYTFLLLLFMCWTIKSSISKDFTHLSLKLKELEKVQLIWIKNLQGCHFPKRFQFFTLQFLYLMFLPIYKVVCLVWYKSMWYVVLCKTYFEEFVPYLKKWSLTS